MKRKGAFGFGLVLLFTVFSLFGLWLFASPSQPVRAEPTVHYVAPGGACGTGISPCYGSLQAAIDAAVAFDEIRIAEGTYSGAVERNSELQVAFIDKTLSIGGGYTTTNWTTPDLDAHPTVLDGQGASRVINIRGSGITPTIESVIVTGGIEDAGGGVHVDRAQLTLRNARLVSNTATNVGGGLYLGTSDSLITATIFTSNTASFGAGAFAADSSAILSDNTFRHNVADQGGAGCSLSASDAIVERNTFSDNWAQYSGSGIYVDGGTPSIVDNTFAGSSQGGGQPVFFWMSDALFADNVVRDGVTGGLYLFDSPVTIRNNVFADVTNGCTVSVGGASPTLLHNTFRDNRCGLEIRAREQEGTYYTSTVTLKNNIIAGAEWGIEIHEDSVALVDGVLWSGNQQNIQQNTGAEVSLAHAYEGDPAFAADGYHLTGASAAVGRGVDAGVNTDIDGDARPMGAMPDLGADEYEGPALALTQTAEPRSVVPGEALTYTIRLTNTGTVDLHATVTDTLPAHVTPSGVLTWSVPALAPGQGWTADVGVAVEAGYTGSLTNTVEATTAEGVRAVDVQTLRYRTCWVRRDGLAADYASLQAAIDAAQPGELLKVAGTCRRPDAGASQVARVDKTLTIRGGYTTTNWTAHDLAAHPTVLDGEGAVRVLRVEGSGSAPTVEHVIITGGNAENGGGILVDQAYLTLSHSRVISNAADNFAGGLYLASSDGLITATLFTSNTARVGAGAFLNTSPATLVSNTFRSNVAVEGGGACMLMGKGFVPATIVENLFADNQAIYSGGGIYMESSDANIMMNTFTGNASSGGGATFFWRSEGIFTRNVVRNGVEDGLYLFDSPVIIRNNVFRDLTTGYAVKAAGSSPILLHNTMRDNRWGVVISDRWQDGVYYTSTLTLANNLFAGNDIGVSVSGGNRAVVDGVLWDGNARNLSAASTADVSVAHAYEGPAAFAADGYHLTSGSGAIGRGIDAGLPGDFDAEPRPAGGRPDLGADEFYGPALRLEKTAAVDALEPGAALTYTLRLTNSGTVSLSPTVTDTLPAQVTPTGVLTWSLEPLAPGAVWSQPVAVRIADGAQGILTNRVSATAGAGAADHVTQTLSLEAPDPLALAEVRPTEGFNDTTIGLDLFGQGFTPEAQVTLGTSPPEALPTTFLSEAQLAAKVPAGLAPGTYALTVTCGAESAALPDAYRVLDASVDDLRAQPYHLWTDPPVPLADETVLLGLVVERVGGTSGLVNVPVRFYLGAPQAANAIGDAALPAIGTDASESTTALDWGSHPAGEYVLYAEIDPEDGVDETDEGNNVISRTITIRAPQGDVTPPEGVDFRINGGDASTPVVDVTLAVTATDNVSPTHVYYVEQHYNFGARTWVPVQWTSWLTYTDQPHAWALHPNTGLRYLQAWVADAAGNISQAPLKSQINYMPRVDTIATGETRIYRQYAEQGEAVRVRIEPTYGDPDLYLWPPNYQPGDAYAFSIANAGEPDEVCLEATLTGNYQIEIDGVEEAEYAIEVEVLDACPGPSAANVGPQAAAEARKTARSAPRVSTASEPMGRLVVPSPEAPAPRRRIFLPLVLR